MKRFSWIAALLLVVGCADQEPLPGTAGIAGVYDVARVGDLVFITSANRSELRVLDTAPNPQEKRREAGYIRAPNPLEFLSIPVLDRPVALLTDTRYEAGGQDAPGRYVFVRGAGAAEISIVGAARDQLRELVRLQTGGPVTALSAHGAEGSAESLLFYAESNAGTSRLMRVRVPAPEGLASPGVTLEAQPVRSGGTPLQFVDAQGQAEQVVALLLMPRLPGATGWRLAVATRSAGGAAGRALLFQLDEDGAEAVGEPVPLDFGRPVRALLTHAASRPAEGEPTPAGARIFGILDESICDADGTCGGVLAVDGLDGVALPAPMGVTRLGQRARDRTGRPMVPLRVGNALVQGLTFAPGMPVSNLGPPTQPLVGILTASDGSIYFFDAVGVQHYDMAGVPTVSVRAPPELLVDGAPYTANPAVRSEALQTVAQALRGELPELMDLAIQKPANGQPAPKAAPGQVRLVNLGPAAAARARVGDLVLLHTLGSGGSRVFCEVGPFNVTGVDASAGTLEISGPLPDPEQVKTCTHVSVVVDAVFKDGVFRDEEVRLTFQGILPGLSGQPVPPGGGRVLTLGRDPASRVRAGDLVEFQADGGACVGQTRTVTQVSNPDTGEVELSDLLPAGCTTFTLRAGTVQPWVMTAALAGYLGRTAEGARTGDVSLPGQPFFHPPGLQEAAPAFDIFFSLPADVPRKPDTFLVFGVEDHFAPFAFGGVIRDVFGRVTALTLPSGVVYVPEVKISDKDTLNPRIFVAYPSHGRVFQFLPASAAPGGSVAGADYQ